MLSKVSILIPCYNAEQWISQAIESALAQTYPNIEIIIVDDGSTDGSLEVIKSFGNKICWETGPNRGGNIARNRLLELSTGEWLQYLDADDYLLPPKIEQQINFLQNNPEVDVVYSASILEHHWDNNVQQEVLPIPEPRDPWILLVLWRLPQTGSPLWRKQALLDIEGWNANQSRCQEHELYMRLLMVGKIFAYWDASASVYRQWSRETVSKKNILETYRLRLEIIDKAEKYLRIQELLTQSRAGAINQSRFECARIIWLSEPKWANQIISKIQRHNKKFVPLGTAAPYFYQLSYRIGGFDAAERIAEAKRKVTRILTRGT